MKLFKKITTNAYSHLLQCVLNMIMLKQYEFKIIIKTLAEFNLLNMVNQIEKVLYIHILWEKIEKC
jgi:hypothetical protein